MPPASFRGQEHLGWAAGSCFAFPKVITGLRPDAPAGKLYSDPVPLDGTPALPVMDFRFCDHNFDPRSRRDGEATRFEVLNGDATAIGQHGGVKAPTL